MTSDVLTVTPDTPVRDAAARLLEENVGSLVVVDEANHLAGMLTITDLARIVSTGTLDADATVAQHMSAEVVTVGTGNSMRDAAAKMIGRGVHHLPVVDDEEGVVGVLSTMDLTAYLSYRHTSDMI
jgi:CBS domain-containing protein